MADIAFLRNLDLPSTLFHRILCRVDPPSENMATNDNDDNDGDNNVSSKKSSSFVLYLPTVVLRKRHNPGFSLACRIANQYQVPVLVLVTLLDDQHLTTLQYDNKKLLPKPVCMSARRLAFTIEALQSCCRQWQDHGAGVAIRIHGPSSRTPHHLTLAHRAWAVVSDEPFVEPYREYLRKIVGTCQMANVPCFTVDGSTTVPPKSKLHIASQQTVQFDICFKDSPSKAWIWQKQVTPHRKSQVYGTVQDGHLDAPELIIKLPSNFFLKIAENDDTDILSQTQSMLPSNWKDVKTSCPGVRPWTVDELCAIENVKEWVMTLWPGADTTVPPCQQTHGSFEAAQQRWKHFLDGGGLSQYAKQRNKITLPHSVSRISCYLNFGILSIFDVVTDVWRAQSTRKGYSAGCQKFLDEVLKWREIGYVHAFATPRYHATNVIPQWSRDYLERKQQEQSSDGYSYDELDACTTKDATWNAMQSYLVETGELHNNARMTWGKTVVHWQATMCPVDEILLQLCCLNDRFALDGLSPPSYAGILWCFGWCDKPGSGGSVTTKWANRYRVGPEGFEQAKKTILSSGHDVPRNILPAVFTIPKTFEEQEPSPKKARHYHDSPTTKKQEPSSRSSSGMKSLLEYFPS